MWYGWITINLLDMRAKPDYHSERVSQVRFSEIVHVSKKQAGFVLVKQSDGYSGWVDQRFVLPIQTNNAIDDYYQSQNYVVISSQARVYDSSGQCVPPYLLYYGTYLSVESIAEGDAQLGLPHQSNLFIKGKHLRPIDDSKRKMVTGTRLVAEAVKFLGVPYLWGGVGPLGFDCSGLVQSVCRSYAIELPRDTKDQITIGREVQREHIKSGDLLFFHRHVALAINRYHFIHASRGSGGIRIESFFGGDPNYRVDLDREFVQARRIL
ncbi:MAG: C40 family peptidase [candidate division Zixibacteria bacterium]|nr:C40 family peptidase [candidate division Zixibacteria bacterium]